MIPNEINMNCYQTLNNPFVLGKPKSEVIIMRNINGKKRNIKKQYLIAAAVCIVSGAVLTGIYSYEWERSHAEGYIVDLTDIEDPEKEIAEIDKKAVESQNAKAENFSNEDIFGWDNVMDATDEVNPASDTIAEEEKELDTADRIVVEDQTGQTEDEQELEVAEAITQPVTLSFAEGDKLSWPLTGNVIMNYSMDKSIYFATLNQYKYNPAIIIQAAESTPVTAVRKGQVVNVEEKADTGTTMVMDLGSDYKVTYGQLKDLAVSAGQIVEAGDIIGYVNAPTKYYSLEGSNLYLKLQHGDATVNPMEYLQ